MHPDLSSELLVSDPCKRSWRELYADAKRSYPQKICCVVGRKNVESGYPEGAREVQRLLRDQVHSRPKREHLDLDDG